MSTLFPMTLAGATVRKRGQRLIGPLDLTLGPRGVTGILGPNGSGKTTFLRLCHGMERLAEGTMGWAGSEAEVRARSSYVFQTPTLMRRTVGENMSYPLEVAGWSKKATARRLEEILEETGLSAQEHLPAWILSGGERQRMAFGRAMISEPQVLYLDEPTANLDGAATREIERLLALAAGRGVRIILATHDLGQARRVTDEILLLHHGEAVETGSAAAFFEGPRTVAGQQFLRGDILE